MISQGHSTVRYSSGQTVYLCQNNYQHDDTYGLSFISGVVVLYSTCFELQGAHHQEFTFSLVQAASGILCNLLLYSIRSPTCSVPDVGEREGYSKRLHSMPEAACTGKNELLMMM